MSLNELLARFKTNTTARAIVWNDAPYTYGQLLQEMARCEAKLAEHGVAPGAVVVLRADYSPAGIAAFFSLVKRGAIVVPLSPQAGPEAGAVLAISQAEWILGVAADDSTEVFATGTKAVHPLYEALRASHSPGLVVFTSGSTGRIKGAVHDFLPLLAKFQKRREAVTAIPFLLFDHLGGINTMLHVLFNAGCLVLVPDRSPDTVLAAAERHAVTLLPVSPTFINLMLLSGAAKRYSLRALTTVSYGSEPMPETTLHALRERYPHLQLKQTYGLTEIGVLSVRSDDPASLFMSLGGGDVQTRVIDGMLEIKAPTMMLGYLNAPAPFSEDGWLITGDAVVVEEGCIRVLGRRSELISVGGRKVYPAEVENVIGDLDGVELVTVRGEANPITGMLVAAYVKLTRPETPEGFKRRVREACRKRLLGYKIPQKIRIVETLPVNARGKKLRAALPVEGYAMRSNQ